jgi:uncharacterized protein (DUF3820 family)
LDPISLSSIQNELEEIGRTPMPFGKFGPQFHPPLGTPIYDLPVEYLAWFASKGGFPKGRLGILLQIVHQMKVDGLDSVFDVFRMARGGRTPLRPPRAPRERRFDRGPSR